MWFRRIPARVAALQLLLWLHCTVVVSSAGSGSGDCSNSSLEPLLPSSHSNISDGFVLSRTPLCGGCITGWRYCYYRAAGDKQSVSATFALWRWSDEETLEVVEGSSYEWEMNAVPVDQWFVCERRTVYGGGDVMEGDMVGVVINEETWRVVGEVEGGEVMVGGREQVKEGKVNQSSLHSLSGQSLLISPVIGDCSGHLPASSSSLSDPPTTTSTPTPTSESSPDSGVVQQFWVVVASAVLVLVIVLLLIMTCFLITISCRQRRKLQQKSTPLQTVLLNGHRKLSRNSDIDIEMHILNTNTTGSAHSTSLSPTPHIASPTPHTLSTGQASTLSECLLQTQKTDEQPLLQQASSPSGSKKGRKNPPPVKPKPPHMSSRTIVPQSQRESTSPSVPSLHQTIPLGRDLEPPHHAALCRSYSEETLPIKRPPAERPNILLPRAPRGSPRHNSVPSRVSTGSLPEFTTPSVDEDDYTIPTHNPFPRSYKRPQPYLQPCPIYSYAYTHVGGREVRTIPRGVPAVQAVKQRSLSERTNPYDSIRTPLPEPHDQDVDYGETHNKCLQERMTSVSSSVTSPPPPTPSSSSSSSSSTQPVTSGSRGALHSVQSSPATVAQPPSTPHISDQPRLMSTGSEGYMNENEYPRPSSSAAELTSPPRRLRYTPLQPTLREKCPTYETPAPGSSTCSDDLPDPLSPTSLCTDYDHLDITAGYTRDGNH